MKAAVCYEFGKPLVVEEISIDAPRRDEVKVKLSACAICHSDILFIDGAWGGQLPAIYGHEGAGKVVACGENVSRVKVNDSVIVSLLRSCGHCFFCTNGQFNLCESKFSTDEPGRLKSSAAPSIHRGLGSACFAEYAIVHQSQVVEVPNQISARYASLLACGVITGWGAVKNTANMENGAHVVVVGAGGVGLNSIQAAKDSRAVSITAVDMNPDRLASAQLFGATHIANSTTDDLVETISRQTAGRGADYVIVTAGSRSAIEQSVKLLRRGGKAVLVGMPAVGVQTRFEAIDLIDANQSILGCKMGSADLDADISELVRLYLSGNLLLDELVSNTWTLDSINEAINATRNGIGLKNVVVF